jgi:hypothetical protein
MHKPVKKPSATEAAPPNQQAPLMRRLLRILGAACACATPGLAFADDSATNSAIDNAFGDHAKYETVIRALQNAVAGHDAAQFAGLVRYPITVSINGRKTPIRNAKIFTADYDAIMTPDIVAAVKNQKYGDLFVNSQGVMFGNEEVWVSGVGKDTACKDQDVKIITIQHGPK